MKVCLDRKVGDHCWDLHGDHPSYCAAKIAAQEVALDLFSKGEKSPLTFEIAGPDLELEYVVWDEPSTAGDELPSGRSQLKSLCLLACA